MKRLGRFSLAKKKFFRKKQDKIELVTCPKLGNSCKQHLPEINSSYHEFYRYHRNKDYPSSIETLKGAFYKTLDLKGSPCAKCGELFRSTITKSLENVHEELQGLSSGFYRAKRYQSSYLMSRNVLQEIKKRS